MESGLIGIIGAVLALWLGSIEVRMRNLDARLREAPSRDEVAVEIDIRQEAIKAVQAEIKEDVNRLEHKIDKLLDKLT